MADHIDRFDALEQRNQKLAQDLNQANAERERLSTEVNRVRTNTRKQLAQSTDLINAVRILDQDYFGDRFFSAASDQSFFADLATSRAVVDAVAEELTGTGAFADSPALRDGIHNLVTALESMRSRALDVERKGLEAVGLPADPSLPPSRFLIKIPWPA